MAGLEQVPRAGRLDGDRHSHENDEDSDEDDDDRAKSHELENTMVVDPFAQSDKPMFFGMQKSNPFQPEQTSQVMSDHRACADPGLCPPHEHTGTLSL